MKIKAILTLVIFTLVIGIDRYTKELAVSHLKGQAPIEFLNGFFSFVYSENTGATLGLGAELPDSMRFFIFTGLVGFILIILLGYLLSQPVSKSNFIFASLVVAGGFGNLYDRGFNDGKVVDFMLLQCGSLRTGIFNVADVAILVGGLYLIFLSGKNKSVKSKIRE